MLIKKHVLSFIPPRHEKQNSQADGAGGCVVAFLFYNRAMKMAMLQAEKNTLPAAGIG